MAHGCSMSPLGIIRLSNSGTCKISGCGQIVLSGELYAKHISDVHNISSGKHGSEIMSCPWEGCGETKTKSCFSNHLLSHSVKSGCGVCDAVIGARSDLVQKHFRTHHQTTYGQVSIKSSNRREYSYLFFYEGVP